MIFFCGEFQNKNNDMCGVSWSIPYQASAAKHVSTRDPGNQNLLKSFEGQILRQHALTMRLRSTHDEVILPSILNDN